MTPVPDRLVIAVADRYGRHSPVSQLPLNRVLPDQSVAV